MVKYLLILLCACDSTMSTIEQPVAMDTWVFSPGVEWFENAAANLPAGTLTDYEPLHWQDRVAHVLRGADNEATRISGLSTDGIAPNSVRILLNDSVSGLDSGGVVFLDSATVRTPNGEPCLVSYQSGAGIYLNERDDAWHFMWGCSSWSYRVKTQALNLYPACIVTVAAGTYNDWNPTCETSYATGGLAGGSLLLKDYAAVVVTTTGAKITGIGSITGGNHDPADPGQVKVMWNNGPGVLEFALEAGSSPALGFTIPNSIRLRAKEGAILFSPGSDLATDHRWHAIGLAQGDVRDRLQVLQSLVASVAELDAVRMTGRVTPAVLPAAVVNTWDPVDATTGKSFHAAYHLRLQGSVGTVLCGLAAGQQGERHLLTNYSSDYLIRSDCPSTPAATRIAIPGGGDRIHRYRGHVEIQYDTQWMLLVN